jgi:TP901 family phage tail tape measure protein
LSSIINIILKASDQATTVLKTAGENITSSMDGAADSISKMSNAFSTAAGVMIRDFAQSAISATTSAADEASSSFMDYEQTLTKILSATDAIGEEADALTESLASTSEAQTNLGYSGREAAEALEALVKAGMDGEDASKALSSALSLARLEGVDTDTAAGLLVQTLTMFNLKASQSEDALNLISKAADAGIGSATDYASGLSNCGAAANNMGMSLQDTLASLVILDKTFGSAVESGTYLNAMFKDLVAKSDDLNINLYNNDGSMKSLDEIVQQLKSNIASYGDNQEAVNAYLSNFDVRAQRAVIGLINYDGGINDVKTSMDSARNVQDKVNMTMDTSAGKMAALQAQQENVSYQFGQMTSQLQLTYQQFALALGPIGAVVNALGPSMLQGAMTGVMILMPQVIASVVSMISTYGIADTATMLLATGTGVLSTALKFLANNPIVLVITALAGIAAAIYYAYQNCEPFRNALNSIGAVLSGALSTAINAVKNGLQWLWDNVLVPLGKFIASTFIGYIQNWINVWNALQKAGEIVFKALETFWNNVLVPVGNYVSGAFKTAWETLGNAVTWVYKTYIKPVFDALSWAYDNILKPVGDFLGGIGNAINGAVNGVGNVFGSALGLTSTTSTTVNVPHMATGAYVPSPTLALVGEGSEAEIVSPDSKMRQIVREESNTSQATVRNVTVNNYIGSVDSIEKMSRLSEASYRKLVRKLGA